MESLTEISSNSTFTSLFWEPRGRPGTPLDSTWAAERMSTRVASDCGSRLKGGEASGAGTLRQRRVSGGRSARGEPARGGRETGRTVARVSRTRAGVRSPA